MKLKTKITKKEMVGVDLHQASAKIGREEVEMTYNVQVNPITQYGSFEMYSANGHYYAEGGLWFTSGKLVDYDGIFDLPQTIKDQLVKWGFKVN